MQQSRTVSSMLGLSLFITAALLIGANSVQASPPVYFAGTGHWYQVIEMSPPLCWDACRDSATQWGGYLASVTTTLEDEFVLSLSDPAPFSFIGGYETTEGVWNWANGEVWSYTNWGTGQPNNQGGNEDRLMIVNDGSDPVGTFHDIANCDAAVTSFIVEYNANPCAQLQTPPQYFAGTGHWYQFVDLGACTPICWTASRDSAVVRGGYLASITSWAESTFVMNNLTPVTRSSDAIWLGATDAQSEGTWEWITGEPWSFAPWGPGEPDDAFGGQDYLYWWAPLGRFHDNNECIQGGLSCFIVEYESEAFCDGFEDPASLSDWAVYGSAQRVATPVNSGSASVEFGAGVADCEALMRRENFSALYGEYSATFRQDNTGGGPAIYIQVQPDPSGHPESSPGYRLGSDASGSVNSQLALVRRLSGGGYVTIGSIVSPVPYSVGEWVRIFIRRYAADSLEFGYEYNGLIYSQKCADPFPITLPGGFYLSSCSNVGTPNYVDDVCYFPYRVETVCPVTPCDIDAEDANGDRVTNVQDVVKVIGAAFRGVPVTPNACDLRSTP